MDTLLWEWTSALASQRFNQLISSGSREAPLGTEGRKPLDQVMHVLNLGKLLAKLI
jgi:hypothetical protein